MKKIFRIIVLAILCIFLAFGSVGCGGGYASADEINILVNWPGLTFQKPLSYDNPVANKIYEKTGVKVKFTFSESDTVQKLTSVFAMARNMPDIIVTPYYGNRQNTGYVLKNAATSGLLVAFSDYYSQYSNLEAAAYTGVEQNLYESEICDEDFNGKIYIMPFHTAASPEEEQNYGYGVFCRKDILETLDVDPMSIHTSEQLYELATRIKKYGFKDVNGNAVIPMSCWQNGWSYEPFINSYRVNQLTSIVQKSDGSLDWMGRQPNAYNEAVFMRKCINEDLFDQEAFNHSSDTALTKHINGSVALTGATIGHINVNLENTLYKEHPEMRYVPVGPIYDAAGNARMPQTYSLEGSNEPAVIVMPANGNKSKYESVLKYLNYINSEEGKNLVLYGIEGEDWYEDESGNIKRTDDFIVNSMMDDSYGKSRGIGIAYTYGVYGIPYNTNDTIESVAEVNVEVLATKYPQYEELTNLLNIAIENSKYEKLAKDMYPLVNVKGCTVNDWDDEFEDYDMFYEILLTNNYQDIIFNCYFAASDAAIKISLNEYNKAINQSNIMDEYLEFLEAKLAEKRAEGVSLLF